VYKGHLPVVERLIAAGADVDKATTDDGSTPLFMAALNGHTAIVVMLLKSGADKSIRGWGDETPLEAAEDQGHAAVVALLRA
jgi:ankyrin repeat protein